MLAWLSSLTQERCKVVLMHNLFAKDSALISLLVVARVVQSGQIY